MAERIDRGALKVIEVIGVSPEGFDDAVQQAVRKASESVKSITGVDVVSMSGHVEDGRVTQFTATVKLAFVVR